MLSLYRSCRTTWPRACTSALHAAARYSVLERFILAQALEDPVLFYYVLVRLLVFAERTHRDTITRLHSTDSNNGHMYTRLSKY